MKICAHPPARFLQQGAKPPVRPPAWPATGASVALMLILAACGGTSAPASSAQTVQPASASAAAKPAGSAQASAVAKPSGPPGSLNIAYVAPADSFVWEMTAYKQGLFQKYGLTVNQPVFVGGTPRLGAAVVGGTFDAAGVGFSAAVDADAAGADLEAVAALSKYAGFSVIVPADSPIKTPKDLKGKTIALSQIGDTADAFLTRLLQQNGLNRATDVNVTQAGSTTNALGQVLAKKVDAASVGNADAFNGQTKGARILANSKSIGMLQPQGSILVKKSWAESHRPQLESLLKAMIDANAKYRSSQEEGLKELQDSGWFKDVPTDVLSLIWKDDVDSWNQLPFVDQDAAKAVIEVSAASNPKVSTENVTSLYDNSYVQELVTNGWVKTIYPDYKG